ncbi:MAG: hypothetical protein PHF37_02385 [Phycisphaerae bacterium]|nr:hypothetical protein [Phycisphaerae bacterium]
MEKQEKDTLEPLEHLDEDALANDAMPVCPNCLSECSPLQEYCDKCGSPSAINPLTPYLPFVNIRFNYGGLLRMWGNVTANRRISFVGKFFNLLILLVVAPIVILIALPFWLFNWIRPKS